MPPTVNLTPIPTGGAVRLDMPDYLVPPSGVTNMVLSRAVSGATGLGTFTQLYSGAPQPLYFDLGDSLPGPLSPATAYVYQVADSTGTTQIGPVVPAPSLQPQADPLTQMFLRLLQAGISNLTLPPGFGTAPQVTTKMPQGGLQALPLIVVNLDLIQQSEIGIGTNVVNPNAGNQWTIWVNATRVWRVSVLSQDVEERDFYRDALISIWQVLLATVFDQLAESVTRDVQAASGTESSEWVGQTPGFYYADIMMHFDGVLNTTIITGYGLIEKFAVTVEAEGPGEIGVPIIAIDVPASA